MTSTKKMKLSQVELLIHPDPVDCDDKRIIVALLLSKEANCFLWNKSKAGEKEKLNIESNNICFVS